MEKIYPFKKAILKTYKGDLSKRWYVEYYVWSEQRAKLIRRRNYTGFTKFDTYHKRLDYGKSMCRELNNLLPNSCVEPFDEVPEEKIEFETNKKEKSTIKRDLDYIHELLYDSEKSTSKHYKSTLKDFNEWLTSSNRTFQSFDSFTKANAQEFVDYMTLKLNNSGKTVANKVAHLKAMTNKLIERDIVELNPFIKLSMPKVIETERNFSFSLELIKKIKEYSIENEPFGWLFFQFIYYSYMRPVEITRLKIKDIDLVNNKIHVAGQIAKNGKTQSIELPGPLKKQLLIYLGSNSNIDHYIFTSEKVPGQKQIGKNYFSMLFQKVKKELKLEQKYTLYSWKHTGVVHAYKNNVNIKALQLQCRHSSIEQTDTYLKSLGFMDNEEFTKGIPTI